MTLSTKNIVLIVFALLLSGCESMTVSECKVADWSRVGAADGAKGESDRRIADYTEDCGKAGIVPNAKAYRRGWDVGIVQFCTAANGWREGVQGHSSKASVCQGQTGYSAFSRYLEAGLEVYRLNEKIQRNTREIARLQDKLEASKKDDEKKDIRADLRHLDREQFRLRNMLTQQQFLKP
ncbi:MAG: DUF2799 domain-containing protein [Burkholderiales bacterium]|jgi:hypothetical protein|nr:DUF2799 domain-containing protein [Burkholderiales bacterium]